MSVYLDMAHDAGYGGDDALQIASMLEQEHREDEYRAALQDDYATALRDDYAPDMRATRADDLPF